MNWLRRRWPMLFLFIMAAFLFGFALQLGFELDSASPTQPREASE